MFYAFHARPYSYAYTQSKFWAYTLVKQTVRLIFFFFFVQPGKKKEEESYSSLENNLWGSSTPKTTKALLFAK